MGLPTNDELNRMIYRTNPTVLSITSTTARTAALAKGPYYLYATVDCYFLQGVAGAVTAGNAAGTDSVPLPAETYFPIYVDGTENESVAGIVDSVAGLLYCIPRGT